MKKVFLIHGFEGYPNGGWRPWLMGELDKLDIYACALPMPSPDNPQVGEWTAEIARNIETTPSDEIYLVGHSLGTPAILRYLELPTSRHISGAVLVSGPIEPVVSKKISNFLDREFDFETIKTKIGNAVVIHGDNDRSVPLSNAEKLSTALNAKLVVVKNGGHLNGSSGFTSLPVALEELRVMFTSEEPRIDKYRS